MKRILITYVSHSGSTGEIARFMGDEFVAQKCHVEIRPVTENLNIEPYDYVIAGGLLYRFGWHPDIIRFLDKNLLVLQQKKVALFVVGLRVEQTPLCSLVKYPIFIDPSISKTSIKKNRNSPVDKMTTMDIYLKRALSIIEKIHPTSLGFFAGNLDLRKLNVPEKLIMLVLMVVTGIKSGDHRNWQSIRTWLKGLNFSG